MNSSRRCFSPHQSNEIVDKCLDIHLNAKKAKHCLKWGAINIAILSILLYDISNRCPYSFSKWYYVEYTLAGILVVSGLFYFIKYLYLVLSVEPIKGTSVQRKLLIFDEADTSFVTTPPVITQASPNPTSMNNTLLSWHSSFNESSRMATPTWAYSRCTPPNPCQNTSQNISWNSALLNNSSFNVSATSANTSFVSPYNAFSRNEVITDEKGLQQLLRQELSKAESYLSETHGVPASMNPTSINSFWNYCNTAANALKTTLYQLSPSAGNISPNIQSNKDEGSLFDDGNSEIIKKIASAKLSQYVANLRMWLSGTILQRLETEINKIDASFKSRGFSDIQIGSVGLERLKKTAENQQFVALHVPMLPMIVPFLEMSTNQEYLVQRIKDLAKGSCIADYRWNSGSSYHGLNWDEHLPTDSAILFHLFCTYLDSQLMPLPQPGGRPFFNRYVVIGDKKSVKETIAEVKNKSRCAILCTNQLKPKFNFISDEKVHNCAHDRNNLFYVIIQFLIYMRSNHESLLEGVNLGKSGINIMCVIGE